MFSMKKATGNVQASVLVNRRTGADRRSKDLPPPTGGERRRSIEPRKPEVTEVEISADQWAALQAQAYPEASAPAPPVAAGNVKKPI